jgi:hypothetical protein
MPDSNTVQTKRDQLAALMEDIRVEQNAAVTEASSYFKSDEPINFRNKLIDFQKRTLPGSQFDQVFAAVISVYDSMVKMVDGYVIPVNQTSSPTTETTASETQQNMQESQS